MTGVDAFTGQTTDNPMGPEGMKNSLIRNIAGVDASKLNGDWWHDAMSILSDLTTGLAPKPAPGQR